MKARLVAWVALAGILLVVVTLGPRLGADGVTHVSDSVGLFEPTTGIWHLRDLTTGGSATFYFGNPGDVPFLGDWDCDGEATPGLFRTSDAFAYLRNSNSQGIADTRFFFGNPSDVPLAGDFDGDGCDTLSVYRPSEQRFYIINELGQDEGGLGAAEWSFVFGDPGDKPVVGDWDGDGVDEVGLHRESTGFFYWRDTLTTGNADRAIFFGDPGDRFVAGDWGKVDGHDSPAVFRPSAATFYFRHTLTQGVADQLIQWGDSDWLPVSGRFALGTGPTTTLPPVGSTTIPPTIAGDFYVRTDGGDPDQCTGRANAPYPGSGTARDCAWDHPFRALPPDGLPRIGAGDTLVIGSGSYMMGLGAPGSENCDPDYGPGCHMPSIPSGIDAAHPTVISGDGGSGCASPPQLWATAGADAVFDLTGSKDVVISCLEVTDRSDCVEDHTAGLACERHNPPLGNWGAKGLYAEDSAGVVLSQLDIHGFAAAGINAGRLTDWTVEDVRIAANGWVGWDGDIDGDDGNLGTMRFTRLTVEWNGCSETYPGGLPTGCWGQSAGGYGDGLGTGETGGEWIFEDCDFSHNTSDGLDLLYGRRPGFSATIRRTIAAENAGDQIKTSRATLIENVVAVSHCSYFDGKPFTHDVDPCRSGGSAIAVSPGPGEQARIINSTLTGEGDCLVIAECVEGGACDGSERVVMTNTVAVGNPEYDGDGDTTCLAWTPLASGTLAFDHLIVSDLKTDLPCPPASMCGSFSGVVADDTLASFDAHLVPGSIAIDTGTAAGAPVDDLTGVARDNHPDIGAYEWR